METITHEYVSDMYGLREEPPVMFPCEEHSKLQVYEDIFDIEDCG